MQTAADVQCCLCMERGLTLSQAVTELILQSRVTGTSCNPLALASPMLGQKACETTPG